MGDPVPPLDKSTVIIKESGEMKTIPLLHPMWAEKIGFVLYQPPPPSCESSVKEEWLERILFLQDDLHWLLKLPHSKFWSQVIFDEQLQKCLDSYLRTAPRHFDSLLLDLDSDLQEAQQSVHKLIFLVFLRMSTHKESQVAYITPSEFGEILYQNFIFDIPKLMDLCVLYSPGNDVLLNKMIKNIFTHQPKYNQDLAHAIPTILHVFESIQEKLGIQIGDRGVQKLCDINPSNLSWSEFSDVVLYVIDISTTLHAFLDVFPNSCTVFHDQGFHIRISGFYDCVIPILRSELKKRARNTEINLVIKTMQKKLSSACHALVKSFRQIIFSCCLQPVLDQGTTSHHDISSHIDDFLQVMTVSQSDKSFIYLYEKLFPFEEDIDMVSQFGFCIDSPRIQYILDGIELAFEGKERKKKEVIPPTEEYHCDFDDSASANAVAACNDDDDDELEGACASARVTGVELDSLITQVNDLLPELGDGFIEHCLEHFNYSVESVIHRLLESSLPPSLDKLDRNLLRKRKSKVKINGQDDVPVVNNQENSLLHDETTQEKKTNVLYSRRNIFDNDEFDVFRRDDIDTSRVILGKKKDSHRDVRSLLNDKKDVDKVKHVYNDYGIEEDESVSCNSDYEDEYDDTYDSHNIRANDNYSDELITRRPFTIPRVLSEHQDLEESENEEDKDQEEKELPNSKDEFLPNPEKLREIAAQNRQSFQRNVRGKPKGQGQESEVQRNRLLKDRHKSQRANHNRKNMADRKRASH